MKHNIYILISFLVIILTTNSCVPVQSTGGSTSSSARSYPELEFENRSYQDRINTVQLVQFRNNQMNSTNNPIIELDANEQLLLTFDDINTQQQQYFAKIIHCNKDWTAKSNIQSMDYLEEYNQFLIKEFEFSFDTKMGYVHYEWNVPKVNISGNYLVVVYQNNNEEDIILSERFMVQENNVGISYKVSASSIVSKRRTHQEIEFEVFLNNINVLNAVTDIHPVVRQNNNWLYAKKISDPFKITDGNKRLVYKFFDGELNFAGGNEFRFFNISTINFKSNGVANINKETTPVSVELLIDKTRSTQSYREWEDRNGGFVIGNSERQNTPLVADYFLTNFNLEAPQEYGDIYVVGEFNNWHLDNSNKMIYDPTTGMYSNRKLLKQGYYEYNYYVENRDDNPIEGNYFNTENSYDILIYYKNPQLRYDRLIGYTKFNSRAAQ